MVTYDPESVRRYFDAFGTREWDRLAESIAGETAFAIHWRLVSPEIVPGMRVLDVGCGPGRYAIEIIRAGASVTLVDISPVQLGLAEANVRAAGLGSGLEGIHQVDICDLGVFPSASFDAVVCYGGGLSYTCERHREALRQLVRVARPGGVVAVSTMTLYGVLQLLGVLDIPEFLETIQDHLVLGPDPSHLPDFIVTQPGSREFHQPMALFSAGYLQECFAEAGCEPIRAGTANPLSWHLVPLEKTAQSPEAVFRFRELELALCEDPHLRDRGDQIIVVGRKRAEPAIAPQSGDGSS
jgi:SAM-dependent methyltransferase